MVTTVVVPSARVVITGRHLTGRGGIDVPRTLPSASTIDRPGSLS